MALKHDFQNTLQFFIYSNLPVLMNPNNATNIVVSNTIIPTNPTTPTTSISSPSISTIPGTIATSTVTNTTTADNGATSTTTTTSTTVAPIPNTNPPPVLTITPDVLQALQAYTLNNFPDIGLPKDIQEVAKNFFSNIPPLTLITPTTAVPINMVIATSATTTAS